MLDHSTQVQPPEGAHNGRKTPKIVEKHLIIVWNPELRLHKVFEAHWKAFCQ